MDVGALPPSMRIEAAILSKAKDQAEAEGKAALSLIEAATQPQPRVPAEAHRGRNLNVVA